MLSKTRYGVFTVILWAAIIGAFLAIAPLTSVARAEALTTFKTLSPELALKLARETLKACRESGYQAVYDYTRPKTVWVNTSDAPLGSQFVAR